MPFKYCNVCKHKFRSKSFKEHRCIKPDNDKMSDSSESDSGNSKSIEDTSTSKTGVNLPGSGKIKLCTFCKGYYKSSNPHTCHLNVKRKEQKCIKYENVGLCKYCKEVVKNDGGHVCQPFQDKLTGEFFKYVHIFSPLSFFPPFFFHSYCIIYIYIYVYNVIQYQ